MMKTLLVAINAKFIHSNLAIHSLKGYAELMGWRVDTAEYTINQNIDHILADIFKQKPELVCFSCYLWNITYVECLLTEIKKILPDVRIWLGGPEVSFDAPLVLKRFRQVDGVMCGEGEETFADLLKYYSGQMIHLSDIKGIVFRQKQEDGLFYIKETDQRPAMDMGKLPFVYKNIDGFENKIIYYESSRGCPFSCSYCLSSIDKCLRFREIELVKKELQAFIDAEVPQVKFVDRTFNCRHEHTMAVWSYIIEHDKGKTNFHFEVAADLFIEEELQLLEKMRPGLIQLEIGIQSTNETTICEIKRSMDFVKVKENVRRIHGKRNIHQHLDLIAGLPYENYESFRKSFNDVYELHPEQLQLGFLKVLKGSYMHSRAEEYGLTYQERPPFEVLSTKWLSYAEILKLKTVEEMVETYYNSGQFVCTIQLLEKDWSDKFGIYEKIGRYYEDNNLHMINHSRLARYEILFDFICRQPGLNIEKYKQSLTMDLYLRDNVKNRPAFAGETGIAKAESAAFYEAESKEHRYLKGYEQYDKRQMRKMTHLEKIDGRIVLFDYKNRDALTNQARLFFI